MAIWGCTKELSQTDYSENCIRLNIHNSLTKAATGTGEAYERVINTLDCFFYPNGKTDQNCVYYYKATLDNNNQSSVSIYVDEDVINKIFPTENTCDIFIIANLPSNVKPGDVTFGSNEPNTDIPSLSSYTLNMADGNYDAIDKPFVMVSSCKGQKDSKKNAQANAILVRAAAKITFAVNIYDFIETKDINNDPIIMRPILTDESMKAAFHNGTNKGYINKQSDNSVKSLFTSEEIFLEYESKTEEVKDGEGNIIEPAKHLYICSIPFYTYAREWSKGSDEASFINFRMAWGVDLDEDGEIETSEGETVSTYYYQILVNGANRNFLPNHWYDMKVNMGVLGSTIESKPVTIEDLTLFVYDWNDEHEQTSGDRKEDVTFEDYTYFSVKTPRLELDNMTTGIIKYEASHTIRFQLNTSNKAIEGLSGKTTQEGAFYIDNSEGAPTAKELDASNYKIEDLNNGTIKYTYTGSTDNIYAPIYIYLTIWLDLDNDGVKDNGEFYDNVTIVQYPPIYILADQSNRNSVYINNITSQTGSNITYGNYSLGKVNSNQSTQYYMYIVSVSGFNSDDKFTLGGEEYSYIIGDPRSHTEDNDLNNDNYPMDNNWAKVDGKGLTYYYPTLAESEAFRLISPKYRISSDYGGYSSGSNHEGAAMRCASYQEDGLPAGRWRLPTTAEVLFVINLQKQGIIQKVFLPGNRYYSSTHLLQYPNNASDEVTISNQTTGSVRCIYDEWYWGNQREATPKQGGGYNFTWGDKQITW